jgi:tryptophanyl-tRNA synthetase
MILLFVKHEGQDTKIINRATHVPVGEDQTQHLELARDLAASFDRAHSTPAKLRPLFPLPEQLSGKLSILFTRAFTH